MPVATLTNTNIMSPLPGNVNAYLAPITPGAGAYGFDTAPNAAAVAYQLEAVAALLVARQVGTAT